MSGDLRVHASVVLADRRKILLLTEGKDDASRGKWNLPGGHVEFGETIAEAAAREAKEEVGVGVFLTDLVGVYTGRVSEDGMSVRFVFGGHVVTGDPAPGDDILTIRWTTIAEAREIPETDLVAPHLFRRILDDIDSGTRWPMSVLREVGG